MKPREETNRDTLPCGCVTIDYDDGASGYDPCLPCALANAGNMLQAAARRITEQTQATAPIAVVADPDDIVDHLGDEPPAAVQEFIG